MVEIYVGESRYNCYNSSKIDIPTGTTDIREQIPQVKRIENKYENKVIRLYIKKVDFLRILF